MLPSLLPLVARLRPVEDELDQQEAHQRPRH
jgi:hypothetical protein